MSVKRMRCRLNKMNGMRSEEITTTRRRALHCSVKGVRPISPSSRPPVYSGASFDEIADCVFLLSVDRLSVHTQLRCRRADLYSLESNKYFHWRAPYFLYKISFPHPSPRSGSKLEEQAAKRRVRLSPSPPLSRLRGCESGIIIN